MRSEKVDSHDSTVSCILTQPSVCSANTHAESPNRTSQSRATGVLAVWGVSVRRGSGAALPAMLWAELAPLRGAGPAWWCGEGRTSLPDLSDTMGSGAPNELCQCIREFIEAMTVVTTPAVAYPVPVDRHGKRDPFLPRVQPGVCENP